MLDHDQLFKELLTTFFVEFLELFFPEVRAYLDEDSLVFLDKEFFTDLVTGEKRAADIVVKAKFLGRDSFFIINVENQGEPEAVFQQRVFFYFAYFHQQFRLPVYPIVVFYGKRPKKQQPDKYRVEFPDHRVLDFHYRVIQLNRLNWRDFVKHKNPVASALMARMQIASAERPFVKLECLRLMASLKLNQAKMRLISGFVDSYLELNATETEIFKREAAKIEPRRRRKVMELTTSWMREGIDIGVKQGVTQGVKQEALKIVLRLLNRRLGVISVRLQGRIKKLPVAQLENLSDALLDFTTVKDLTAWLDKNKTSGS
ncbi:MAG: DUF4351 domain-containing protein [Acidobacteria bacterium]|nr:DUF4351 domain-containing protein [Acidobacteriota bacterium]